MTECNCPEQEGTHILVHKVTCPRYKELHDTIFVSRQEVLKIIKKQIRHQLLNVKKNSNLGYSLNLFEQELKKELGL